MNSEESTKARRLVDGKEIGAEKRRKFEAKQQRQSEDNSAEEQEAIEWMEKEKSRVWCLSQDDIDRIRSVEDMMMGEGKRSFSESLIHPYVNIHGKDIIRDPVTGTEYFIAEGSETIRCLLQQTSIHVMSVFLKPNLLLKRPVLLMNDVKDAWDRNEDSPSSSDFKVLVSETDVISDVAGFPVTRGALGCGIVPRYDENWLADYIKKRKGQRIRLVAFDRITDTANLGSIIRTACALGVDAMVLSSDSCDAWYRKCVRVSMGTIFRIPIVRVRNLPKTLKFLLASGICSYASSLKPNAIKLESIANDSITKSWCLVLGNEGNGVSNEVCDASTWTIKIGMSPGVDSLGVAVAAGILIHGLITRETDGKGHY